MGIVEQIILVGIFLGLLYLWAKSRSKVRRARARYRIAFAHFAKAADQADSDLAEQFEGMLPTELQGVTLLRLSVLNRGDRELPADHFDGPISIILPESSRILAAVPATSNGVKTSLDGIRIESSLNRLEIQPFEIISGTSVIFSIVVDGGAEPLSVVGRFRMQDEILPLSEAAD